MVMRDDPKGGRLVMVGHSMTEDQWRSHSYESLYLEKWTDPKVEE